MSTMRDIATEVGVSVSLVSKVLNNRLGTTRVSPDKLAGIRRAVTRIGYCKNVSASALKAGRHNVVGVYIHRVGMEGSGIIEELLDGISAAALQHGQRLQLSLFSTTEQICNLYEGAHPSAMDGLMVGGLPHGDSFDQLSAIHDAGLPVVTIYDDPRLPSIPNVGIDQILVGRLATEHLIAQGARRIVHIRNLDYRFRGYCEALAQAGLPYDPACVFDASELDYSHVTGERAVLAFQEKGIMFDGIVTQSDQEAVGAMNVLFERGLCVPDDVKVIGIDNAPFCKFSRVPLSSVSQNNRMQGLEAMRLILNMIDGQEVQSTTVQPLLIARQSSNRIGAVPKEGMPNAARN